MKTLAFGIFSAALVSLTEAGYYSSPSDCPANSWFNDWKGTCECNWGLTMVDGKCVGRCGKNEKFNGWNCDCAPGYARLDGTNCLKCPVNGHWNDADQ